MTTTTVTKTRKARTRPTMRVRSEELGLLPPAGGGTGEEGVEESTSVP